MHFNLERKRFQSWCFACLLLFCILNGDQRKLYPTCKAMFCYLQDHLDQCQLVPVTCINACSRTDIPRNQVRFICLVLMFFNALVLGKQCLYHQDQQKCKYLECKNNANLLRYILASKKRTFFL